MIQAQERAISPASPKEERFSNFAVAVGVVFVGRFVGDAHGKEGERRAGKVQAGVSRIRQHAQRAGEQASRQLEQRHSRRSQHRLQRDAPLRCGVRGSRN